MTTRNILSGAGASPAPPAGAANDGSVSGVSPGASQGGQGGQADDGGRIRVWPDPERDLACGRLALTDLGNAERWRIRYGADFRFCPELGWFAWVGTHWRLLSEEKDSLPAELIRSIMLTVRAIRNEAALIKASGTGAGDDGRVIRIESALPRSWIDGEGRRTWFDALPAMDFVASASGNKVTLHSEKIAAWAKSSEAGAMVGRVIKWIKGFPDVVVKPDAFDTDRLAINVANGTLRIVRNSVKRSSAEVEAGKSVWKVDGWKIRKDPHRRDDLITKLAPVKYAPAAKCPHYDDFIARVQPSAEMRDFIHQWGGLSLTGDIGEHKLAFFYGGGRNGKGTWVEAIAHLAGDYAGSIGVESLADSGGKRRGDQATPDLARLPGVRFLRVSEPERGMKLNDGLIKQLTGGDPVDARHLNKGFFTFLPSFKLTISGNNKPNIRDLTHGMWARMQLVPWSVTIPEEQIDRRLPDKLKEEASGILNRLIEGLLAWRENGLIVPEEVKDATRAYREDSDQLGRFLAQCCEVGDDPLAVRVGATELWQTFEAWVEATGAAEWKRKGFVGAMNDRGFVQKTSNGVWWLKVRLRDGVTALDIKEGRWSVPDAALPPGAHDMPPEGYDDGRDPFDE